MVEDGGGPLFPVVFFDGEREIEIGNVKINPSLEYKTFQLMLSQKIGISPNQISIYLVDRKKNPKSPFTEDHRRIPITGKVNFGLICRQNQCCFLVVLKKSRKSKNRKERMINGGVEFANFSPENDFSRTENPILLRRNQPLPFYDHITQPELADLNDRLHYLRVQRENYHMSMAKRNVNSNFVSGHGSGPNLGLSEGSFSGTDDSYRVYDPITMIMNNDNRKDFCDECVNAKKNGSTKAFHPCLNDAVIVGFRTRLGPISRPYKLPH